MPQLSAGTITSKPEHPPSPRATLFPAQPLPTIQLISTCSTLPPRLQIPVQAELRVRVSRCWNTGMSPPEHRPCPLHSWFQTNSDLTTQTRAQ